jgi:glyoxylase-like metal-dependent hydrolase (beta-lactamase superfamily II)
MKITDDVYALDSTKGNYVYVILDEDIVLIDTGRSKNGLGIINDLKIMDIKPHDVKDILITHHDMDHIGSLAFLEQETSAKIWASNEDIPVICGKKNRDGIKRLIKYFIRIKKPKNITPYPENQRIGDIEIIPTPGHTRGHVCLLYKDILFVGDLLRTSNGKLTHMHSLMNWNDTLLNESIAKIAKYDFKWICPAHGEPIKNDGQLNDLY